MLLPNAKGSQVTVCALFFDQGHHKNGSTGDETYLGQNRCTNPTWQSNRAVSSFPNFLVAKEYEQRSFNEMSHLVVSALKTEVHKPTFTTLSFRKLNYLPFICTYTALECYFSLRRFVFIQSIYLTKDYEIVDHINL